MKIKVKPEDFVVQELIHLPSLSRSGPYTILKLEKRYWNTLDAIDFVARRLRVSKNRFSRAGLKDRYALSTQYLSFLGTIKNPIEEKNFTMVPIGRADLPIAPSALMGNAFSITLRSLDDNETEKISKNYRTVHEFGMPNYFDEQRFGSARHRKGFFARELMLDHYNGALKLLLCYPYKEDGKQEKNFKNCCQANWEQLSVCQNLAPRNYRKIINYLVAHPGNHKDAIKLIEREFLNIYLLAYQSYLFNQVLGVFIEQNSPDPIRLPYSMGQFVFYHRLKEPIKALKTTNIPILNEKTSLTGALGAIANRVLEQEGVTLKAFALRKLRFRGVRFKTFARPAIVFPEDFKLGEVEDDDLYINKKKVLIEFILPSGAYATLLIKRLLI